MLRRYDKFAFDITEALEESKAGVHQLAVRVFDPTGYGSTFLHSQYTDPLCGCACLTSCSRTCYAAPGHQPYWEGGSFTTGAVHTLPAHEQL
jgi:hypothetical protein